MSGEDCASYYVLLHCCRIRTYIAQQRSVLATPPNSDWRSATDRSHQSRESPDILQSGPAAYQRADYPANYP